MDMKIYEARSDDEPGGIENLRVFQGRKFSPANNLLDDFTVEEDVHCSIGFGCRIKDAAILNQEHARNPSLWELCPWRGDCALRTAQARDGNRLPLRP